MGTKQEPYAKDAQVEPLVILRACGDPKAKPSYLIDKNLESAVKFIVRKFPAVETRNNNTWRTLVPITTTVKTI
ncbi:hypothetical protein NFI96_003491 [Prochilodus magdalenae]|nr:hypothetical protein NFI96_003491 [Prochilodus magdalenae]